MKAFINCPICNSPLMNNFQERRFKPVLTKYCNIKLNHNFSFEVQLDDNQDTVKDMTLIYNDLYIMWFPDEKRCLAWNKKNRTSLAISLPYFEPNFSNYQKLIEKIKLCILFS